MITFLVRTANVHSGDDFDQRLELLAARCYEAYSAGIGLIGLQEVGCGEHVTHFAAALERHYGTEGFGVQTNWRREPAQPFRNLCNMNVGAVSGGEWQYVASRRYKLAGAHSYCSKNRRMVELLLQHNSSGMHVRLFSVHLTAGSGSASLINPCEPSHSTRRLRQVEDIVATVRSRSKDDNAPPIVVGDFNAGRDYQTGEVPERSVLLMEQHFRRASDELHSRDPQTQRTQDQLVRIQEILDARRGVSQLRDKCDQLHQEGSDGWITCNEIADQKMARWEATYGSELESLRLALGPATGIHHVYLGRPGSFPNLDVLITVAESRDIDLSGISDHNLSPGFLLRVGVKLPHPAGDNFRH